jgi:DNA repair protein RecN (Recombination protein N)
MQKENESSAIIADEVAKGLNDRSLTNFDYENLEDIDNRLYSIRSLARKFSTDTDGLEEVLDKFREKLKSSECQEEKIEALNKECESLLQQYLELAHKLSEERSKIARDLSARVNEQLLDLNMADSKISINLTSNTSLIKSSGIDEASLSINHCGNEIGKLSNVASGGEKSRITLAFRIATCQNKKEEFNPILLFDEVDTGVGGFIARKVGEKLKNLGLSQQILSITHNPQVVSLADNHLMVSKSKSMDANNQEKFISVVRKLDKVEREKEVARMISGLDITDEAIRQAKKLLYS